MAVCLRLGLQSEMIKQDRPGKAERHANSSGNLNTVVSDLTSTLLFFHILLLLIVLDLYLTVDITGGVAMQVWACEEHCGQRCEGHSERDRGLGGWCVEGVRLVGGEHKNTQRPDYLGKQARAQNQTLCHWGRSIGGGLRSVFGASSSSGQGGSGGLQGKEKQTYDHCYSPCPSYLKLTSIHGYS